MTDIKAAKKELLFLASDTDISSLTQEVAREDFMDRTLKRYFNASSQDERHLEAKRLGIALWPDTQLEAGANAVHVLLMKHGGPGPA